MNKRLHPRCMLIQARKLGPDLTKMGASQHTMELIAHSLCIANSAPAKVARKGWPGKTALLNGQSMGPKSELHQNPGNAHARKAPFHVALPPEGCCIMLIADAE